MSKKKRVGFLTMTSAELRAEIAKTLPEDELQRDIIDEAVNQGWPVIFHAYDMKRNQAGWPDLTLMRAEPRPRLIFAELKKQSGRTTPAQKVFLAIARKLASLTPFIEVYEWRPLDRDAILETLKP